MAEKKPKSTDEFLYLLASGQVVEVQPPPGTCYQYADELSGDHFFVVEVADGRHEFRTGFAELHDTDVGLVWGFRSRPGERVVKTLRRGGAFLLRAVSHAGVGVVAQRLGIKLEPARKILDRFAGVTENDLVRIIVQVYGPAYVQMAVARLDKATAPDSPGGESVTADEAAQIGSELLLVAGDVVGGKAGESDG